MDSYVAQKASSYLGIARVDLDQISFDDALKYNGNHRKLYEKDLERMLGIFTLEGCVRDEEHNFIEGLITEEHFDDSLADAAISKELFESRSRLPLQDIDDVPRLRLCESIQCNDGLHRISAAKRFLDNNDRWWVVKLYRKESEFPLRSVDGKLTA